MKTTIFACRMLEQELNAVLGQSADSFVVKWFEKGLHNSPDRLRDALQKELDGLHPETSRVILTYGYCGGCIAGLHSHAQLIIPRVDDCLTLLLGSHARRLEFSAHGTGAYFLTEAWIDSDRSITVEYDYTIQKYGEKSGREIFNLMFRNYSMIALLDTGLCPIEAAQKKSQEIADALGLQLRVVPATLNYLRALVFGPWPKDRFVVLEPGESLSPAQAGTMMNSERNE